MRSHLVICEQCLRTVSEDYGIPGIDCIHSLPPQAFDNFLELVKYVVTEKASMIGMKSIPRHKSIDVGVRETPEDILNSNDEI